MRILAILNRVFDILLDRTALFALIKDNKKLLALMSPMNNGIISFSYWHMANIYDCLKIPKSLHQPN